MKKKLIREVDEELYHYKRITRHYEEADDERCRKQVTRLRDRIRAAGKALRKTDYPALIRAMTDVGKILDVIRKITNGD